MQESESGDDVALTRPIGASIGAMDEPRDGSEETGSRGTERTFAFSFFTLTPT